MKKNSQYAWLGLFFFALALNACGPRGDGRPDGWSDDSHGKRDDPDYRRVFDDSQVERIDLTIKESDWDSLLKDMESRAGPFGQKKEGDLSEKENFWVSSRVKFQSLTWWEVGLRFRGSKKLLKAWEKGSYKLPLKLDFDQFEEENPELKNQRFFGFKQLNLQNNWGDGSYLREKVAADIFREAGAVVPESAFVRVFIDHGSGPVYFGLYVLEEVADDPSFLRRHNAAKGQVFEAKGGASSWKEGSSVDQAAFEAKNSDQPDLSRVKAAISAVHDESKEANAWRDSLEEAFDVSGFLQWLAVDRVMVDPHSYGYRADNYSLLSRESAPLMWLTTDHDHALTPLKEQEPSLDLSDVGSEWPLIQVLLSDPEYRRQYWDYVASFYKDVFSQPEFEERFRKEFDLISPFVTGGDGESATHTALKNPTDFQDEFTQLLAHISDRRKAVAQELEKVQ